jgi:hypothetical protein
MDACGSGIDGIFFVLLSCLKLAALSGNGIAVP